MNLTDIINNWPQSADDALVGTKYEGADARVGGTVTVVKGNMQWQLTRHMAWENAAKCEVQAALIRELVGGSNALGGWMSAALEDPQVCIEMKRDIKKWFTALGTTQAWLDKQEGK